MDLKGHRDLKSARAAHRGQSAAGDRADHQLRDDFIHCSPRAGIVGARADHDLRLGGVPGPQCPDPRRVFSLKELSASFYGGTLGGSASVDVGRNALGYAASVRLERVDVDSLLTAHDAGLKDLVHGRLAGTLDLSASGSSMDEILGAARGTGALEIADGAVTSFSVLKQIAALLEMAGGRGIGKASTPFQSLSGDLAVADRKARREV